MSLHSYFVLAHLLVLPQVAMASEPPAPRLVFAHLWSAPLLEEGPHNGPDPRTPMDELDVIAER